MYCAVSPRHDLYVIGPTLLRHVADKYGETRCCIRDPDGYIIEVGQSKAGFAYG
jgi:hypothetical protein